MRPARGVLRHSTGRRMPRTPYPAIRALIALLLPGHTKCLKTGAPLEHFTSNICHVSLSIPNMLAAIALLVALVGPASAQFPPKPEGLTILKSKWHENVTISFKEVSLFTLAPKKRSALTMNSPSPGFARLRRA